MEKRGVGLPTADLIVLLTLRVDTLAEVFRSLDLVNFLGLWVGISWCGFEMTSGCATMHVTRLGFISWVPRDIGNGSALPCCPMENGS